MYLQLSISNHRPDAGMLQSVKCIAICCSKSILGQYRPVCDVGLIMNTFIRIKQHKKGKNDNKTAIYSTN